MTEMTGEAADTLPPPHADEQHQEPLFVRSDQGRIVGGVCAGVAQRFSVDVTLVRVVTVVLALLSGVGVVAYVAGWLLTPSQSAPAVLRPGAGTGTFRLPRSSWWRAVVAVVLAVVALAAANRVVDGDGWDHHVAGLALLALLVVALAQVARWRWAVRLLAAALALLLAALVAVGVWGQHFATTTFQVSTPSQLDSSYDQGVGSLHLDLTQLTAATTDAQSDIHIGRGDAFISVPAGTPVFVHARTGMGAITLDGRRVSGLGAQESRTLSGTGAGGQAPTIELDITVGIGDVVVTTGP